MFSFLSSFSYCCLNFFCLLYALAFFYKCAGFFICCVNFHCLPLLFFIRVCRVYHIKFAGSSLTALTPPRSLQWRMVKLKIILKSLAHLRFNSLCFLTHRTTRRVRRTALYCQCSGDFLLLLQSRICQDNPYNLYNRQKQGCHIRYM